MNMQPPSLNIALLTQSADDATGLGRIVSALAEEYVHSGHSVHIVSQRCTATAGEWHRVPDISAIPALAKLGFRIFEGAITAKLHAPIIHAFGVGSVADIVAAQSCHRAAVKLQQDRGGKRIRRRNFGIYDRLSLADERRLFTGRRRKLIVAVSQLVRKQILEEYEIPETSICTVPNGVHLSRFARERGTLTDRSGKNGPFVLLFVGNEFDRKGVQTIIEALPSLQNISLEVHIAGDDDPAPFVRRARELDVCDRLRFLGRVPAPEQLFMTADALVFPTHYEPFGMVIIEAMAAGIPVITSRTAGAVEDLTDGVHGLYLDDPYSSGELSRRIRLLLEDATLRETLSRNGRMVAERYGWPVIAARYIDLYRKFCP
jgi:glycosyltransferase involved in cell wall biosynthesis